jgi:hypothetical protein
MPVKKKAVKKVVAKKKVAAKAPAEEEVVEETAVETIEDAPKTEAKEVVVRPPTQLSNQPIAGGGKRGLEEADSDDMIIPYAKLMQPLSPEVDEGIAVAGQIVNSLTKFVYGTGLLFIPLVLNKRRIYWKPRDEGQGIICGSSNFKQPDQGAKLARVCSQCRHSQWGSEGEPPECSAILTFPALAIAVVGDDGDYYELPEDSDGNELVAISFLKTSYGAGKQLVSMASFSPGDLFDNIYELNTFKEKNDKGTYHVFKVQPSGQIEDEIKAKVEGLYNMLLRSDWDVNLDQSDGSEFSNDDETEGPFD